MALDTTGSTLGPALASAAGCPSTDAVGQAKWAAIAAALMSHIVTNAVVSPVGVPPMSNAGGAVGGTGKIL